MEENKTGIKETKEAFTGILTLALFFAKEFKDGVDWGDFTNFMVRLSKDEAFRAKIDEARIGIDNIPAELKDMDFEEGMELVGVCLRGVINFVKEMKTETSSG